MKYVFALISLLWALPVAAQTTLNCTLPATVDIVRAQELCELLRIDLRVPLASWSNDVCASQMTRIGLRSREREESRKDARETIDNSTQTALNTFDTGWPTPTQGFCGDATVQTEVPFNEACDNGTNDGTLCNPDCTLP